MDARRPRSVAHLTSSLVPRLSACLAALAEGEDMMFSATTRCALHYSRGPLATLLSGHTGSEHAVEMAVAGLRTATGKKTVVASVNWAAGSPGGDDDLWTDVPQARLTRHKPTGRWLPLLYSAGVTIDDMEVGTATSRDVDAMARLFARELEREPNLELIESCVGTWPAATLTAGGELIGFAYSRPFAPDVLELLNIVVASSHRSCGLGGLVLARIEEEAAVDFAAMILVNSDGYTGPPTQRAATGFYLRNGYDMVLETSLTRVFWKAL